LNLGVRYGFLAVLVDRGIQRIFHQEWDGVNESRMVAGESVTKQLRLMVRTKLVPIEARLAEVLLNHRVQTPPPVHPTTRHHHDHPLVIPTNAGNAGTVSIFWGVFGLATAVLFCGACLNPARPAQVHQRLVKLCKETDQIKIGGWKPPPLVLSGHAASLTPY
jgi:hypothetical protein